MSCLGLQSPYVHMNIFSMFVTTITVRAPSIENCPLADTPCVCVACTHRDPTVTPISISRTFRKRPCCLRDCLWIPPVCMYRMAMASNLALRVIGPRRASNTYIHTYELLYLYIPLGPRLALRSHVSPEHRPHYSDHRPYRISHRLDRQSIIQQAQ
jgi:hypothetical protein